MTWIASPGDAAAAASLGDELSTAAAAYYQGKITSSIQTLRRLADRETSSGSPVSQQSALEYLLDACVGGMDYACLQTYVPIYDQLIATRTDVPPQLKRAFALHVAYYFGVMAWMTGQPTQASAWLKSVPESVGEELWDVRNYIRRQLLRARLYLVLEDYQNAQLCVDRALMTIASVKNSGSSLVELTFWLSDAIEILNLLGDSERAFGLVQTEMAFGQKVLPPDSLDFYWVLIRAAGVLQAVGSYAPARDLAQRSYETLSRLELSPNIANYLRAESGISIAMMCLVLNDLKCANAQLLAHPAHDQLTEIRKRGVLRDFVDVSYFAMRTVIDAAAGGPSDDSDAELLAKPLQPQYPMPDQLRERLELYRRIAHALMLARSGSAAGKGEMQATAPELLRIELEGPLSIGPLRRLDAVQHLMNDLVLMSFANRALDAHSGDLVVRLLDLESRSGTSFSVEALALMAAAKDENQRERIRSVLRLASRRDSAERSDIGEMLAAKPKRDPTKPMTLIEMDFGRRTRYSDYGRAIRQLVGQITDRQPELALASRPPSLQALQRVIGEHEAIVGTPVFYGGVMGYLCVRHGAISFVTDTPSFSAMLRDTKLLNAALTAQYEPSPQLDSQYPVKEARHLFDALFRPIEGCLQPHDTVLWTGEVPYESPLAALLTSGSPESLAKSPLSEWPWFVKSYETSYVGSLATLTALRERRVPAEPEAGVQFAGIGDPLLTGITPDGDDRAKLALRGAVGTGELSSLPPLPDTKTELEDIGALFPQRATLLTGGDATEAAFRHLPLESYRYLSFATHGLVREDISGLTEPALALTPESATDPFNDGLLTASEIADLPLRAQFVALSACNTATLDFTKYASEVPALSAAFEVDGVSSVLATFWPVDSDTSKRVVKGTFQRLVAGAAGPATALAESQRDYLERPPSIAESHPRFWAPFAIFGDSIPPKTDSSRHPSPQIGRVRLLTHTGGEVHTILSDGSGGFVLRGIGDIRKGRRHASLTMGLDSRLEKRWVYENDEIANADIAALEDGVLALGFRGGGERNPVRVSVESLSETGRAEYEWALTRAPDDTFPAAAIKLSGKAALFALNQSPAWTDPNAKPPDERLILVEGQLRKPAIIKVDMVVGSTGTYITSLAHLGDSILVAVTNMFAPINSESYFDEFHQLRGCMDAPQTKLFLFDTRDWRLLWEKDVADAAMMMGGNSADGTAYFVGSSRKSCQEGNRLSLWDITKAREIRTVYLDDGLTDTQGTGMALRPDGSALLFGKIERLTDVASMEERDTTKMIGRSTLQHVNFSTRETSDLALVELNSSGKIVSREIVRAGSDLWVRGAVTVGSDIWMYGALGGEAALIQLRKQQPRFGESPRQMSGVFPPHYE